MLLVILIQGLWHRFPEVCLGGAAVCMEKSRQHVLFRLQKLMLRHRFLRVTLIYILIL